MDAPFQGTPGKEEHMEEGKKKRKYTEGVKQSNRQWDANNLDRMSVAAPKGTKARWKAAAEVRGQSLNQFIVEAVEAEAESPVKASERPAEAVQPCGAAITEKARKAATEAAEATGEALEAFVERAVVSQAERDRRSWSMGINPATGEKAGE